MWSCTQLNWNTEVEESEVMQWRVAAIIGLAIDCLDWYTLTFHGVEIMSTEHHHISNSAEEVN